MSESSAQALFGAELSDDLTLIEVLDRLRAMCAKQQITLLVEVEQQRYPLDAFVTIVGLGLTGRALSQPARLTVPVAPPADACDQPGQRQVIGRIEVLAAPGGATLRIYPLVAIIPPDH